MSLIVVKEVKTVFTLNFQVSFLCALASGDSEPVKLARKFNITHGGCLGSPRNRSLWLGCM